MCFHIPIGASFNFQGYSITRVSARKLEAHLGGRWIGSVPTLKQYDELLWACRADHDELQAASDLITGRSSAAPLKTRGSCRSTNIDTRGPNEQANPDHSANPEGWNSGVGSDDACL